MKGTCEYTEERLKEETIICQNCGKRFATWNSGGFLMCSYCKGAKKRFITSIIEKVKENKPKLYDD